MQKKDMANRASREVKVSSRSAAAGSGEAQAAEHSDSLKAEDGGARWRSIYALVPVAIALVAYLNTLSNGFAIDDISQLNNAFIKKLSNLPFAFTGRAWALATEDVVLSLGSYYRPFLNVLFTINYALFGE